MQLKQGVHLHVLPTEKYKTTRIFVRFSSMLDEQTITKRSLLSNLLDTNSKKYPTQTLLSEKLAKMYGASFGSGVSKKGNYHFLSLVLNVVNGNYLPEKPEIFTEAISFLEDIIFSPNINQGAFDRQTFEREKIVVKEYIESIIEDKQSYAALKLQELYFDDATVQGIPSFGDLATLESETAESIAEYYQYMITHDRIDVFVLGDVSKETVIDLIKQLPFTEREVELNDIFYHQPILETTAEAVEKQDIIQSKLNIAYQTGTYYFDQHYFPLMIFNGIFGGFPHSKLFMNVREKHSMAYYTSSGVDLFRGMLTVQTGIDCKNKEHVLKLINEQLVAIQAGEISTEELEQTKAMLKNSYLLSLDNPTSVLEQAYSKAILPDTDMSPEEWLTHLAAVTKEDVVQVANEIKQQAIFFLEGGTV